jgi:hypothetical protein
MKRRVKTLGDNYGQLILSKKLNKSEKVWKEHIIRHATPFGIHVRLYVMGLTEKEILVTNGNCGGMNRFSVGMSLAHTLMGKRRSMFGN